VSDAWVDPDTGDEFDVVDLGPDPAEGTMRRGYRRRARPEEQIEAALGEALDPDRADDPDMPEWFRAVVVGARGSGSFASAAVRDAAIRGCCRAVLLLARLVLRRFGSSDV
jgi:hypothetical protein